MFDFPTDEKTIQCILVVHLIYYHQIFPVHGAPSQSGRDPGQPGDRPVVLVRQIHRLLPRVDPAESRQGPLPPGQHSRQHLRRVSRTTAIRHQKGAVKCLDHFRSRHSLIEAAVHDC